MSSAGSNRWPILILCMLGIFHDFLLSADFFQNQVFQNFHSGVLSGCQTVWIQVRVMFCMADLGLNYLQRSAADEKNCGWQARHLVIFLALTLYMYLLVSSADNCLINQYPALINHLSIIIDHWNITSQMV